MKTNNYFTLLLRNAFLSAKWRSFCNFADLRVLLLLHMLLHRGDTKWGTRMKGGRESEGKRLVAVAAHKAVICLHIICSRYGCHGNPFINDTFLRSLKINKESIAEREVFLFDRSPDSSWSIGRYYKILALKSTFLRKLSFANFINDCIIMIYQSAINVRQEGGWSFGVFFRKEKRID